MANKWFETVAVAQRRAKKYLPKDVYGALIAGAEAGVTIRDNVDAFSELGFAPHVAGCPRRARWRPGSWGRTSRCRC
jgi:pre-mycofactocin synthase